VKLQFATVSIEPTMPRWWRIRPNDIQRGGVGIHLPDYAPMGCRRHCIALTVLLLR
jgi:hypothetical protein